MFWQISAFSELSPTLFLESERKHMKKIWIFLGPLCNQELLTYLLSTIPMTFPYHKNSCSWSNGALESSSTDSETQQSLLSWRQKRATPILLASLILKIFCRPFLTNTFCLALTLSSHSEPNCNSTLPWPTFSYPWTWAFQCFSKAIFSL